MRRKQSRFISIRTKFLILFCLLITLPFLFSGFLTYQKYSSNVERDAQAYSEQIAEQVAINLERYVKEMDRITLALYYDSDVMQILDNRKGTPQSGNYLTIDERRKMNQLISSVSIDRTEIEGVFIFALDGSLFSNLSETIRGNWEPNSNTWMRQVKLKDGGLVIIPPVKGSYYLEGPREVLSLARLIKDPVTTADLGYVKIDLTSKGFEKIISSVRVTPNSKLYVFNDDLQQLYPFTGQGSDSYRDIVDEHTDHLIISEHASDYGGMRVVSVVPRDDVLEDARQLTSFTLWISVAALILAYLSAMLTSNTFVKPINHLLKKMRRVQNGDFQGRAEIHSRDEVGLLTEGFNTMVSQLEIMIKEMYELRLREKDSELSALQSQINPHFLYNTLESISMFAHKEKNEELSHVITSLGKLLRYTVNNKERFMTLREELAFVEHYLNIQTFRLDDKLTTEISSDFSHELAIVPKLILQPLVENAIEHGLSHTSLKITIMTKVIDQDLFIFVMDNGKGIAPEHKKEVETKIYESTPASPDLLAEKLTKGFAMRNIHQRLKILYGGSYGLKIEETRASGTSIYIRIPFQWEE
jgi:two-component system sensor histidine kinase YesM